MTDLPGPMHAYTIQHPQNCLFCDSFAWTLGVVTPSWYHEWLTQSEAGELLFTGP